MRKPDVAYALIKTHAGLKRQALSAVNRFLRIVGLAVEANARGKKELVVVEESTEEEGGQMSGSEDREEDGGSEEEDTEDEEEDGGSEEEDTEDEEDRQEKETGGRMVL